MRARDCGSLADEKQIPRRAHALLVMTIDIEARAGAERPIGTRCFVRTMWESCGIRQSAPEGSAQNASGENFSEYEIASVHAGSEPRETI
jgi:hypothetical protein